MTTADAFVSSFTRHELRTTDAFEVDNSLRARVDDTEDGV